MSCGVGCRHGSDPALLWLWRRPVATALIRPLAWEPPYAAGAAQEIATTPTTTTKICTELPTAYAWRDYLSIKGKEPIPHTAIAPFGTLISTTLGHAGLGVQFPRSEYF